MVRPLLLAACLAGLVLPSVADAGVRKRRMAALSDPLNAQVWVDLGKTYKRRHRRKAAMKAYTRALTLDPENEIARAAMADVSGLRLAKLERKAMRNPQDDEIWGDLGDKYAAMGDRERAVQYYMYAARLDPGDSEWRRKIGEVGGPELAAQMMREMVDLGTADDETLGDIGDTLWESGDYQGACEMWEQAAQRDPGDSEWQDKLGRCYGGGEYGQPYGGYEGGYGYEPEHQPYPHMPEEGIIGGIIGGPPDGYPGIIGGGGGLPFSQPGISGGLASAAELAVSGTDAEVLVALARVKLLEGDREGAIELYGDALQAEPVNADAMHAMMSLTGKTKLVLLQELIETTPPNDELYGDLGDTQLSLGNPGGALEAFEKALELDPGDTEWQQKIVVLRNQLGSGLVLPPE